MTIPCDVSIHPVKCLDEKPDALIIRFDNGEIGHVPREWISIISQVKKRGDRGRIQFTIPPGKGLIFEGSLSQH